MHDAGLAEREMLERDAVIWTGAVRQIAPLSGTGGAGRFGAESDWRKSSTSSWVKGNAAVSEKVPSLTLQARPRLPRGVRLVHNEAQGGWVLLAPERVFKADAIAAEVVKRCTGEATLETIVEDLARTFGAPRERVLADVTTLLQGLADKKLLET